MKELEPWVGEGEHEIGGLESEKSSVSWFYATLDVNNWQTYEKAIKELRAMGWGSNHTLVRLSGTFSTHNVLGGRGPAHWGLKKLMSCLCLQAKLVVYATD